MIVSSYRYRLYPTKAQESKLHDTIEVCREIYNDLVFESRLAYKEGYSLKFDELQRMIPAMIPVGKHVYSKTAQVVLRQFQNNLKTLSNLTKRGKRTGSLRFKSKSRYRSINYNQSGFCLGSKTLKLSKIGKLRITLHRPVHGKIKEIRIKREPTNQWCHHYNRIRM